MDGVRTGNVVCGLNGRCGLAKKEGESGKCCIVGCEKRGMWGCRSCGKVLCIPDCFDLHMYPGTKHIKYKRVNVANKWQLPKGHVVEEEEEGKEGGDSECSSDSESE